MNTASQPEAEKTPLYRIAWRSLVNGRSGVGTKRFTRAEASRLAQQLNEQFPDIEHELVVET